MNVSTKFYALSAEFYSCRPHLYLTGSYKPVLLNLYHRQNSAAGGGGIQLTSSDVAPRMESLGSCRGAQGNFF